ncbi:MAG: VCBS repeat-containing protein, partial [Chloroflexi bacterium]|nr:VCBS repeat-containing protein [Chloroflexota bacterium]
APSEPFEDLDKDGYADLVVSGYQDDASCNSCYQADSYIYWGSATGYDEGTRTALESVGAKGNLVVDLNNDGHLDIVFVSNYDGNHSTYSYIYWGDGSRTGFNNSPRQELFNYGGGGGGVADLNQDGYPDLVLGGYNDGDYFAYSYIYWGNVSGYSQENRTGLNAYGTLAVDIGDLNKDGYLDLVLASYYDGNSATNSYIYWGSETGYSWLDRHTVPTYRARDVKIADLNNDTNLDLVFANQQTDGSYLVDSYV